MLANTKERERGKMKERSGTEGGKRKERTEEGKRKERREGEVKIQTSFRILCYLTLLDIR